MHKESQNSGNGMSNFLSGVAVVLSTLALLFSGFTVYQVFTLQQKFTTAGNTIPPVNPNPVNVPVASPSSTSSVPVTSSAPSMTTQATSSSNGVQPGQFVQSALNNKAQVELLKVNRISGQRDVVNVQVRVRALRPDKAVGSDSIYMGGTTARNPETSETYKDVNGESTGSVSLFQMRLENQSSADAYVWLRVPEGVNTVDIYMPNTQAFKNVPIAG